MARRPRAEARRSRQDRRGEGRALRIVAALAWYDEPTAALERLVRSLAPIADAIVAADGPFALYGGDEESPAAQKTTLALAARETGLEIEFLEPRVWTTQIAKRKILTSAAVGTAGRDGWMLVVDGDEWVFDVDSEELWRRLEATERDVAYVSGQDTGRRGELGRWRRLFRALPNLTVWQSHQEYVLVDRVQSVRRLHGNLLDGPLEEAEDLSDVLVLGHDAAGRPFERQKAARRYYVLRNQSDLEC